MFSLWSGYSYYDMNAPPSDPLGNVAFTCLGGGRRKMTEQTGQRRRLGSGSGSGSGFSLRTFTTIVPPPLAACEETGSCDEDDIAYAEKVTVTQLAMQAKFKGTCAGAIADEEMDASFETDLCSGIDTAMGAHVVTEDVFEGRESIYISDNREFDGVNDENDRLSIKEDFF